MGPNRRQKLDRLVALQQRLHQVSEWKLADLQRQENELKDLQRSLIETLNADEPLHGLFVGNMAKRLTSMAEQAGRVAHAKENQSRQVLAEARRLKQVERIADAAAVAESRADEKRRLEDLIDQMVAKKRDASFG